MTQPSRRGRYGSRLSRVRGEHVGPRRLGSARRAQMITTYGVGSMIAVDSESFIVRGIDSWRVPEEFGLTEPRLQHRLRVDGFHLPPAGTDDRVAKDGVRAARFPEWYSCSTCHALNEHRRLTAEPRRNKCGKCRTTELTPSRFVVVCENGHLDDFPYWSWVHKKSDPSQSSGPHSLSLRSTGRTASLRSIEISCSCGITKSLEGALSRNVLKRLGIGCRGRLPWLKNGDRVECTADPRAIQRGSSTAWFAEVASALTIPPWSHGVHRVVRPHLSRLIEEPDERILTFFELMSPVSRAGYQPADLVDAVRTAKCAREEKDPEEEDAPRVVSDRLRREEYEQLRRVSVPTDQEIEPEFQTEDPGSLGELPGRLGIEQVMLVPRLREVRALTGFTRLEPPTRTDGDHRSFLARNPPSWLPAIEVVGEGVFLRLGKEHLARWKRSEPAVQERTEIVRRHHLDLLESRAGVDGPTPVSPVTPELLLVHTLAHVLINEWSLDCGYPASSLRERLYVDRSMAGVLIYTATSDSAGSLGGLVSQGRPQRLTETLESALERASWCSADPLCIESPVSGVDNLNIAACHCCVLLPETSCEEYNSLLDRGMLTGLPEAPAVGFFSR
jgi:hypothetical protein